MPSMLSPSGKRMRMDPATVLHVVQQHKCSAGMVAQLDRGFMNVSESAARRCTHIYLNHYAWKLRQLFKDSGFAQ
jgi:hypothetical protein